MKKFLEVFKKLKIKRVALLGVEESGSVYALEEFIRLAPEYGVEVVYRDSVLWDLNDFNSIVTKISATNPDYLLFNLGGENLAGSLLKSLENQKVQFKYTAITSFDVLEDTSKIEDMWYVSDSYLPDEFANRFSEIYGHKIKYGIGNFYEAMRLLIQSFENAEKANAKNAIKELSTVKNQPSIFGPTSVNEKGIFTYPAKYVRIVDGKRKLTDITEING